MNRVQQIASVHNVCQAIYDSRRWDDLPLLSDLLEELELLEHPSVQAHLGLGTPSSCVHRDPRQCHLILVLGGRSDHQKSFGQNLLDLVNRLNGSVQLDFDADSIKSAARAISALTR